MQIQLREAPSSQRAELAAQPYGATIEAVPLREDVCQNVSSLAIDGKQLALLVSITLA